MLNPHLAIFLAHERERELRQARESASIPRQLADHHGRARRREDARFSPRWPLRSTSPQLCSDASRASD
jgi:hypothetical protein